MFGGCQPCGQFQGQRIPGARRPSLFARTALTTVPSSHSPCRALFANEVLYYQNLEDRWKFTGPRNDLPDSLVQRNEQCELRVRKCKSSPRFSLSQNLSEIPDIFLANWCGTSNANCGSVDASLPPFFTPTLESLSTLVQTLAQRADPSPHPCEKALSTVGAHELSLVIHARPLTRRRAPARWA